MAAPYPMKYVAPAEGADPELEPQPVTIYDLPAVPTTAQVRTAVSTKPQIVALTNVATANAAQAAGATPTKAEYDAVVALANANKAAINSIIAALKAA